MIDLITIEETIDDLIQNAPTSFKTCEYIAHLAITREVYLERMNNQDISKDRSLVHKMIGQLEKGDDMLYGNNS